MLKITIKIRKDLIETELINEICTKYHINSNDIQNFYISKKSIDARDKSDVHYVYTINMEIKNENKYKKYKNIEIIKKKETQILKLDNTKFNSNLRPVIIGSGPAGLFSCLTFIENGICPIILEQGKPVEERQKDILKFLDTGHLNAFSNVQFGEGGAGTFSDGKLTTNINSPYCKTVLETFVKFGAPKEILYLSKPHIGTDYLINILKNMRNYILSKGGSILFNSKLIDFEIKNNTIYKAIYKNVLTGNIDKIDTNTLILAIGHSSRDTFYKLYEKGIYIEPKNFSVGVRIEHLQKLINKSQYGTTTKLELPSAEYKLAYHSKYNNRSCYTFCMCPGGTVIPSSSEENTIVTNGMSEFLRDGENANSAILVNITPNDFSTNSPLGGIEFQKNLEEKAFKLGGSNYYAPIQTVEDFLKNKVSKTIGKVTPTYKPGVSLTNLNSILPDFVSQTLKEGIMYFGHKLEGFDAPDSILTGVETRSSSPVKIVRNKKYLCNINGIYPCGEGAGYAGGIMTAAIDGIKCATNCLKFFEE